MMKDYQVGSSPYDNAVINEYDDGTDPTLDLDDLELSTPEYTIIHTVLDGQTLQNIAYQYYKDSGLWYIIALANNIQNPFSDELHAGQQLMIPNYGS